MNEKIIAPTSPLPDQPEQRAKLETIAARDLCPCERRGAIDPWCHAAGMCCDEPEVPRT